MATPMKRWFRVADSVTREPWSNDEAALFLRLLGHFNARRSRDRLPPNEASVVVLRPGELCSLAGCQSLVRARRILDRLKMHVSLIVDERGAYTSVEWPKLPEFQGWASGTRENAGHDAPQETPPPDSGLRSPVSVLQEVESSAPPAPTPKAPRRAKRTDPPEALGPDAFDRLRAWCTAKHPALAPRLADLVDACLTFHRGKGNLAADWYATCQTWVRNEAEQRFGRPGASGPQRPEPGGTAYRQFKPEVREGVAVVSVLSELRKAVTQ